MPGLGAFGPPGPGASAESREGTPRHPLRPTGRVVDSQVRQSLRLAGHSVRPVDSVVRARERLARRVPGHRLSPARETPRHPLRPTGRVVDSQVRRSLRLAGHSVPPVDSVRMVRSAVRPVALVAGGGFGGPGPGAFGPPGGPATAPVLVMPPPPSRTWADRLFGQYSRHFNLEHLWFLWYLLVFVTVAPLVVKVFAWIFLRPQLRAVDDVGRVLIRYNVVALLLGLATLPLLVHARGFVGWSLANPIGFLAPFPDFLFQYYADVPYYFSYFLAGWWLYRLRDGLSDLARTWLWNLVLGIAGFAVSQRLSNAYAMQPGTASPEWIRLVAFALYGSGAAYTTCASLGSSSGTWTGTRGWGDTSPIWPCGSIWSTCRSFRT